MCEYTSGRVSVKLLSGEWLRETYFNDNIIGIVFF